MTKVFGIAFVLGFAVTAIAALVTGDWRYLIIAAACYFAIQGE